MGILLDGLAIALGGLFGSRLHKSVTRENYHILGISIMMVSLVGFLENVYSVRGSSVVSEHLLVVLAAYMLGSKLGSALKLEQRLGGACGKDAAGRSALVDAVLFFGVGGLQICGPIALALHGDNSQLFLKSAIDGVFALALGQAYGKTVALSALPVAAMQAAIAAAAYFAATLFREAMITQLCAMGYVLLFFTGFNLMTDGKYQISNVNMLPAIGLVLLYNLLTGGGAL